MAPTPKAAETDAERKARLIAVARAKGVAINVRDDADAIQAAIDAAPDVSEEAEGAEDDAGTEDPRTAEVADLQSKLANVEKLLDTTTKGAEASLKQVDELEATLKALREENTTLRSDKAAMRTEIDDFNLAVFDLKEKLKKRGVSDDEPTADDDIEDFSPKARPKGEPEKMVTVKVTKKGHNEIFTGSETGKTRYARNDVFEMPQSGAKALEDKGWVETD